jgi:hypothetical protein
MMAMLRFAGFAAALLRLCCGFAANDPAGRHLLLALK